MRIPGIYIISILVVSILTLTNSMVLGATDQDIINDTENITDQTNDTENITDQTNDTENITDQTNDTENITFIEKTDTQTTEETIVPKPTKSPGFGSIISIVAIISMVYMFRVRKNKY